MNFLSRALLSAAAVTLLALSPAAWAGPMDDNFSSATLDPKWTFTVYGDAQNQESSVAVEDGQLVMVGGGSDIWGRSDNGVYLWQAATGDFRITLKLVNLVPSSGAGIDASAKLGIMVRQDMDVQAPNVFSMSMPKGVHQQRRTTRGGDSAPGSGCPGANCNPWPSEGGNDDTKIPIWVRVTRIGNVFTMEMSYDGIEWQSAKVDPNHADNKATVNMTSSVLVGIGLTSHKTSDTAIAVLDDFTFEQLNDTGPAAGQGFVVPAVVNDQGQVQNGAVTVTRDGQLLGTGFSGQPMLVSAGPVTADAGGMLLSADPVNGTVEEGKTLYLPITATFGGTLVKDLSTAAGQAWLLRVPEPQAETTGDFSAPGASEEDFFEYTVPSTEWDTANPSNDVIGWVRTHVTIPAEHVGKDLVLHDWNFDDQDWTYWNGVLIGSTNSWNTRRSYFIPGSLVQAENVLAIRGRDGTGGGGITTAAPKLVIPNPTGIIEGTITNDANQPMSGVTVRGVAANSEWGPQNVTVTSGPDGKYRLAPLGPGEYTVTFGNAAFNTDPTTVTITVAGNQTVTQNAKANYISFFPDPLNPTLSDNFSGTSLDAKWTQTDLGPEGNVIEGVVEVQNNTLSIEANGADIWGTADAGTFIHQPLPAGDFVATVKVTGVPDTNAWSKAGIMVRANTTPGSANTFAAATFNNQRTFQWRPTDGAATSSMGSSAGAFTPGYLRLQRIGNTFSAFWSPDGTVVQFIGSQEVATLGSDALLGLAVTSHVDGVTGVATFEDFRVGGLPVTEPQIPSAPTGLTATGGNGQVDLYWAPSSGATGYNVKRATTAGGPYTTVNTAAVTGNTFSDTGLTNGTTYYYVVSAVNAAGESANSTEASATPNEVTPTVPAAPANLAASGGDAQVTLTWDASTGAASYNVKRGTAAGGPYTTVNTSPVTATTFTDTGLTNGTTYYYVVSAVNAAGESANSAEASAMPVAPSELLPGVNKPHNPYPAREQRLIESFETTTICTEEQVTNEECVGGSHSFSANPPTKPEVSLNTDPRFVSEGTKSLKVDMAGVEQNWFKEFFRHNFAEPVDPQGFRTLSMQVYAPNDPDNGFDLNTSWHENHIIMLVVNADGTSAGEQWYGIHSPKAGWNYWTWDLNPLEEGQKYAGFIIGGNAGAAWTGPIFYDALRLIEPDFTGIKSDEELVIGWDTQEQADKAAEREANVPVELNTDPAFIKDGAGSLMVDMTALGAGWFNNWFQIADIASDVDLSNASAIHLDVFVPAESVQGQPWWQIGFGVGGTPPEGGNGWAESNSYQLHTNRWNTIKIPLVTDPEVPMGAQDAYRLNNIGYFELRRNAGGEWMGPIYLDNLRIVVPTTPPTGCKGDANGDGQVNVADAVAILRHAVNIGDPLAGQNLTNAKVTDDDTVDVTDAVRVLQAIVGVSPGRDLIPNLTCP